MRAPRTAISLVLVLALAGCEAGGMRMGPGTATGGLGGAAAGGLLGWAVGVPGSRAVC